MAAGLESLPKELFDEILYYVDTNDLLALRRVSRAAKQSTQDWFAKVYLSKYQVFLSNESSLRSLLAIVQDDQLARSIKSLRLCTDRIDERDGPQWAPNPEYWIFQARSRAFDRRIAPQKILRATALDVRLLTEIFARFRAVRNICVQIEVGAAEMPSAGRDKFQKLSKTMLRPGWENKDAIEIMLWAIQGSHWHIPKLNMSHPRWLSTCLRARASSWFAFAVKQLLGNLTSLEMLWDHWLCIDVGDENFKQVSELFASMPMLQSLTIRAHHFFLDFQGIMINTMLERSEVTTLRVFRLYDLELHIEMLCPFVRQNHMLEKLELERCQLTSIKSSSQTTQRYHIPSGASKPQTNDTKHLQDISAVTNIPEIVAWFRYQDDKL
jgi:hypothetical protein